MGQKQYAYLEIHKKSRQQILPAFFMYNLNH
jgi:hypothetical protein